MRRDQRRVLTRRLTALDNRERDTTARRWGWLESAATFSRQSRIDRSTDTGRGWYRFNGMNRDNVRTLAAMARASREDGTDHGPGKAALFSRMAGVAFQLRKPVT